MELKSPSQKRKGSSSFKTALFPIHVSDKDSPTFDRYNGFELFCGYFNGNSIIVDDPEEIRTLYTMGFYGKASLSKHYPSFAQHKKDEPTVLKEAQWNRRKQWSEKMKKLIRELQLNKVKESEESLEKLGSAVNEVASVQSSTSAVIETEDAGSNIKNPASCDNQYDDTVSGEINTSISDAHSFPQERMDINDREVLVINDCKDVDDLLNLNARIEVEQLKTVVEVLHLSLEEAFFLSFGLGCLQVMDLTGKPLSILQIWQLFNESQNDFIENYVAYHYFRSKGWVVKPGIKFGGQFLLYKKGPSFYHASYIVLIENIAADTETVRNREGSITWNKMNILNRMAETCNKEILVCKIKWPAMSNDDKENPLILKSFKVQEYLLRRWQPCMKTETLTVTKL